METSLLFPIDGHINLIAQYPLGLYHQALVDPDPDPEKSIEEEKAAEQPNQEKKETVQSLTNKDLAKIDAYNSKDHKTSEVGESKLISQGEPPYEGQQPT